MSFILPVIFAIFWTVTLFWIFYLALGKNYQTQNKSHVYNTKTDLRYSLKNVGSQLNSIVNDLSDHNQTHSEHHEYASRYSYKTEPSKNMTLDEKIQYRREQIELNTIKDKPLSAAEKMTMRDRPLSDAERQTINGTH